MVGPRITPEVMLFDPATFKIVEGTAHDVEGAEGAVVTEERGQLGIHQKPEGMLLLFPLEEIFPERTHQSRRVGVDLVIEDVDDREVDTNLNLNISGDFGPAVDNEMRDGSSNSGNPSRLDCFKGCLRQWLREVRCRSGVDIAKTLHALVKGQVVIVVI